MMETTYEYQFYILMLEKNTSIESYQVHVGGKIKTSEVLFFSQERQNEA